MNKIYIYERQIIYKISLNIKYLSRAGPNSLRGLERIENRAESVTTVLIVSLRR